MKKEELIQRVEQLEAELLETQNAYHNEMKDSVLISQWDYNNYERIREDQNNLIDKNRELSENNIKLVNSLAELNGGVLKDLSQTIVNLTKQ